MKKIVDSILESGWYLAVLVFTVLVIYYSGYGKAAKEALASILSS